MRKNTYKFALDTKLPSQFVQPRVVNGDTSNVFEITLTDKGKAISLSSALDKIVAVFRRADGLVYTQDEETGVTRKTTNTISIDVHRDSFRTGQNTVEIVIFSREDDETEEYAGQITTCQGFFTARNENLSDNPQGSLPQLPMLEQLIADAQAAVAAANAAITAASAAAEAANAAAGFAHDEGLLADEKAQDAAAAASAANAAAALINANGMPYLLTAKDVTHPTATSIDCGVEQTYAEVMATHTDTVYRPLCIVLDGYLLYERSYQKNGDAGLTVTMTADTGMGTSINATLVAQSRFGGIVGITALYESASEGGDDALYVLNIPTPYWNGSSFEGDADKTTEEVVAAIEAGKTFAVRIADADDETVYTMIEAYSSTDADEVRCESKQAYCTVYAIGSTVQIHGALRVISEDDVV